MVYIFIFIFALILLLDFKSLLALGTWRLKRLESNREKVEQDQKLNFRSPNILSIDWTVSKLIKQAIIDPLVCLFVCLLFVFY